MPDSVYTQVIDDIRGEIRAAERQSKKPSKRPALPHEPTPLEQLYASRGIDPKDLR